MPQTTLLLAPIELVGDWGASTPEDALVVLSRTREVCLAGIRLLSDHQPTALLVEFTFVGAAVCLAGKLDPSACHCRRHRARLVPNGVSIRPRAWSRVFQQLAARLVTAAAESMA